jgi:hypothetical protein
VSLAPQGAYLFFAHGDFFPSPPLSPQLPSYAKDYIQILVVCLSNSRSIFPHIYDNYMMCFIDFEAVER